MKTKSSFLSLFVAALLAVTVIGCKDEDDGNVAVTGVTLDQSEYTILVGAEFTLTATVEPPNATNQEVEWSTSSSNTAVVTDGKVEAKVPGQATITVTTVDGAKTAMCIVIVEPIPVPVTGVSLNKSELELNMGDGFTLTATIEPAGATNRELEWTSSDPDVASVTGGAVLAKEAGMATITVRTADGNFTATCEVTVISFFNLLKNPGFEEPLAVEGSYGADEAPQNWEMVPLEWFQNYPPYVTGTGEFIGELGEEVCTPDRIGPNYDPFVPSYWGTYCNWYTRFVTSSFVARSTWKISGGLYQIVNVIPNKTYEFGVSIGYGQSAGGCSVKPHETLKILSPDGMTTYRAEPIPAREIAPQWHVWRPNTYEGDIPDMGAACWVAAPIRVEGTVTIPAGVTQIRFQIDQRHFTDTNLNAPVMLWDDCVFVLQVEEE